MKDMMEYKGYHGSVHYSDGDRVIYGKIEFIRSLVSYEGTDVKNLRTAFEETVDDYLELCGKEGKEPEILFKEKSSKQALFFQPKCQKEHDIAKITQNFFKYTHPVHT
ncbi:MAG: hypothetical protein PVG39_16105 [Desulfobacteraceae bacterium]|jgi:predicted HicB family RNase H-like nuclease